MTDVLRILTYLAVEKTRSSIMSEYFRRLREAERERYLSLSPYSDAIQRWREYEKLILHKYEPYQHDRKHFHRQYRVVQALDEAWRLRDKHHQRLANRASKQS